MLGYSIYEMFFVFFFWGVIGWMIEVVDMKIETGELQNRGFLHMPICPLYGLGMLVMSTIFKNERSDFMVLFITGIFVGSFIEYLVGWILEKVFNTRWWDYSHMRFQLNGRVCLRNTILFGIGAIFTIGFVQPMVEQTIYRIPASLGFKAMVFLMAVLFADTVLSVYRAWQYRKEFGVEKVFIVFKSHK